MGASMSKSAKVEAKKSPVVATTTAKPAVAKPTVKAVAKGGVPTTTATTAKPAVASKGKLEVVPTKPTVVAVPTLNPYCVAAGFTGTAVLFHGTVSPCEVLSTKGDTLKIRIEGKERAVSRGLVFPGRESAVKAVAWASRIIRAPVTTFTAGHPDVMVGYRESTHTGTRVSVFSADDIAFGARLYTGYVYDGACEYQPPTSQPTEDGPWCQFDCYTDVPNGSVSWVRAADLRDPIAGTDPVCQVLASEYIESLRSIAVAAGAVTLRAGERPNAVDTAIAKGAAELKSAVPPSVKGAKGTPPAVVPAVAKPTAKNLQSVKLFGKDHVVEFGTDGVLVDARRQIANILGKSGHRDLSTRLMSGEKSADVFAGIKSVGDREGLRALMMAGKARIAKTA